MYSSSWWIVVEIASRINEALSSAVSDISGVSLVCCLRIYARRTATPSFRPMIFRLARSGPEHGLGWGGCRPLPPSRVEPLLMSKHLSITSHPMVDAITSFNGDLIEWTICQTDLVHLAAGEAVATFGSDACVLVRSVVGRT